MTPPEYKKLRESLGTQAKVARILGVNRVTIVAKRVRKGTNVQAVPARNELGTSA